MLFNHLAHIWCDSQYVHSHSCGTGCQKVGKGYGNGTGRLTAPIALCIGTKSIGQLVCHYHAGALGLSIYNIVCNKCNNICLLLASSSEKAEEDQLQE